MSTKRGELVLDLLLDRLEAKERTIMRLNRKLGRAMYKLNKAEMAAETGADALDAEGYSFDDWRGHAEWLKERMEKAEAEVERLKAADSAAPRVLELEARLRRTSAKLEEVRDELVKWWTWHDEIYKPQEEADK